MLALYGPTPVAAVAFPLLGFCISAMYSIIFSTALNTVLDHPGALSGILCSGIFGGALFPFLVGFIADLTSLRAAYMIVFFRSDERRVGKEGRCARAGVGRTRAA